MMVTDGRSATTLNVIGGQGMLMTTTWTVRELATLAGVSVRTLHHYHQIGLLLPGSVGDNGYRRYGTAELVRLQQILFFRELEFPLDQIRELLDRPEFDAIVAYRDHRRLLVARREQLEELIATLDTQLIPEGVDDMTINDSPIYGRFTAEEMDDLRAEAKERWGGTDAWRQSKELTSGMGPDDFRRTTAKMGVIMRDLVAVMPADASAPGVQAHVATYRSWLSQFAPVTDEVFGFWANMYVDDDRFAETFRQYHPELPVFLRDAMLASLRDRS